MVLTTQAAIDDAFGVPCPSRGVWRLSKVLGSVVPGMKIILWERAWLWLGEEIRTAVFRSA